jgi:hypothetical protein
MVIITRGKKEVEMGYIDPETVDSPKASWKLTQVIYNSSPGLGGWSAAEGEWEGDPCLGVRWNGDKSEAVGVGNPQSRGYPTWFIIPEGLEDAIRREIKFLNETQGAVSCRIWKPDEYDIGAWRVEVTLAPQILARLAVAPVFSLPSLQNRSCHADKGYARAIGGELRGCFVDGTWLGDVYSNGIAEEENPTKINAVENAFIENVMRALASLF